MYKYYRQQNSTLPKLEPSTELNFLITSPLDFFCLSHKFLTGFNSRKKKHLNMNLIHKMTLLTPALGK